MTAEKSKHPKYAKAAKTLVKSSLEVTEGVESAKAAQEDLKTADPDLNKEDILKLFQNQQGQGKGANREDTRGNE